VHDVVVTCTAVDEDAHATDGNVTYRLMSASADEMPVLVRRDDGRPVNNKMQGGSSSRGSTTIPATESSDAYFDVDRWTGAVSLKRRLPSNAVSAELKVVATDGGSPSLSSVALVRIGVRRISGKSL
jgi:hypothetical protein